MVWKRNDRLGLDPRGSLIQGGDMSAQIVNTINHLIHAVEQSIKLCLDVLLQTISQKN